MSMTRKHGCQGANNSWRSQPYKHKVEGMELYSLGGDQKHYLFVGVIFNTRYSNNQSKGVRVRMATHHIISAMEA